MLLNSVGSANPLPLHPLLRRDSAPSLPLLACLPLPALLQRLPAATSWPLLGKSVHVPELPCGLPLLLSPPVLPSLPSLSLPSWLPELLPSPAFPSLLCLLLLPQVLSGVQLFLFQIMLLNSVGSANPLPLHPLLRRDSAPSLPLLACLPLPALLQRLPAATSWPLLGKSVHVPELPCGLPLLLSPPVLPSLPSLPLPSWLPELLHSPALP